MQLGESHRINLKRDKQLLSTVFNGYYPDSLIIEKAIYQKHMLQGVGYALYKLKIKPVDYEKLLEKINAETETYMFNMAVLRFEGDKKGTEYQNCSFSYIHDGFEKYRNEIRLSAEVSSDTVVVFLHVIEPQLINL